MKRILFLSLAVLFGAFVLSSCGGDDDPAPAPQKPDNTNLYLSLYCSPEGDFYDYYDITATYTDVYGVMHNEVLSPEHPLKYEAKLPVKQAQTLQRLTCQVRAVAKTVLPENPAPKLNFSCPASAMVAFGSNSEDFDMAFINAGPDNTSWLHIFCRTGFKGMDSKRVGDFLARYADVNLIDMNFDVAAYLQAQ